MASAPGLAFGHVVHLGIALAVAGAGILHLDAAGDHTDHAIVAAFFVVVGVAQLLWAAAIARPEPQRRVLLAGLAGNAAVLGIWIWSRTAGLPDLAEGVGGVEEIGWKDAAASGLALAALATAAVGLAMPAAAARSPLAAGAGERVLRAMAVATLAVTVPGVLATHAHGHGDDHTHGDEHAHGEELDAALAVVEHGEGEDHDHGHGSTGSEAEAGAPHVHAEVHHGDPATAPPSTHVHGPEAAAAHAHDPAHDTHTAAPVGADHSTDHEDHAGHGTTAGALAAAQLPPEGDPLAGIGEITTVRLGPFALLPSLPGLPMPHLSPGIPRILPGELNLLPLIGIPAPCQDCYVLGMQPDLVYQDGTPANLDTGPMLHHAVWADPSRSDPVCRPGSLVGALGHRLFASGNERTGFRAPDGFGLPLGTSRWTGAVELMNMSSQLRIVYVQLSARWVPRSTPGIEPATSVWLDVDSCGDSAVDVPAGLQDLVWDWESSLTGRIITAGGHVHDGGEWISLRNESTGEHLCTSIAGYGTKPQYLGAIESMSVCSWDRLGVVRAGERLRLTARYNSATPVPGAMGIMVMLLHETEDLTGGTPSPYPSELPASGAPMGGGHAH